MGANYVFRVSIIWSRLIPWLVGFLLVAGAAPAAPEPAANLVEYSYGGFAEGFALAGPMLFPPMVKIYQDGRIVFIDESGMWEGHVPPRRLRKLRSVLARSDLLSRTQLVPVRRGSSPGFHGGMAYIRHLDGEDEVVIGAFLLPSSGPWHRLVKRIRSCIPSTYSSFVPAQISVRVLPGGSWGEPVAWPFSDTIPLADHSGWERGPLTIDDRRVISFILSNAEGGFSWVETAVTDADGQIYNLHLESVPGWYEPTNTELTLGALAYEAEEAEH